MTGHSVVLGADKHEGVSWLCAVMVSAFLLRVWIVVDVRILLLDDAS